MLSIAIFMVCALAVAGGVLWWTKRQSEQEGTDERAERLWHGGDAGETHDAQRSR